MNAICSFCYYEDKIQWGPQVKGKNFQGQEKDGEFYFESEKIDILFKKIRGHCDLNDIFP